MSRGYWRLISTVGLTSLLVVGPYAQPVGNDSGAGSNPDQASRQPISDSGPTPSLTIKDAIDRAARALEAANEKTQTQEERDRAKRDLDAQENMAWWAMGMFWSTAVSVGVGIVTLLLVWRTVIYTKKAAKATRDQVKEARRSGEDRVAAKLVCTGGELEADESVVEVRLTIKNSGLSIARSCDVRIVKIVPLIRTHDVTRVWQASAFELDMSKETSRRFVFQVGGYTNDIPGGLANDIATSGGASFKVQIRWSDVFGRNYKRTLFAKGDNNLVADGSYFKGALSISFTDPIPEEEYTNKDAHWPQTSPPA